MFRFALLLRCLLILALCLDGGVGVWRATTMAAGMVGHVTNASPAASHSDQLATASVADEDCNEAPATRGKQSGDHGDCDCTKNGCACACAFAGIAFTHAVPFAAQHLLATKPAVPLRPQIVSEFSSAVFRPPIG